MKVPCIESNGEVTEIECNTPTRGWQREAVIDDWGTSYNYTFIYESFDMGFRIDSKNVAKVVVLVCTGFKHSLPATERRKAIEDYIKTKAPWIFTYGKRVHNSISFSGYEPQEILWELEIICKKLNNWSETI